VQFPVAWTRRSEDQRKYAGGDEFRAQLDAIRRIQRENGDGGATALRSADDDRSIEAEMTRPMLATGIEKAYNLSSRGIDSRKVGAFMVVVVVTVQGEVSRIVGAAVLFRHDMLKMQAVKWPVVLMDSAVFAALASPIPNQIACRGIHRARSEVFKNLRAFAWMMAR
jgi:hypothetical protein